MSLRVFMNYPSFSFQAMDAGAYNYAIAFQERIKISDEKMEFYKVQTTLRG